MSLVLKDVRSKHHGIILEAFQADIKGIGQCAVVIRPFLVEFRAPDHVLGRFELEYRALVAKKVRPPGQTTDWLLILTETTQLYALMPGIVDGQVQIVVVQTFDIDDMLDTEHDDDSITVPSTKSLLEVDQQNRFIVLYCCRGFLLVFELRPSKKDLFQDAAENLPPPQVVQTKEAVHLRLYKVFEDPIIVPVGLNPIELVRFLPETSEIADIDTTWIALVVRDQSLRYFLSWYKISKLDRTQMQLVRRMAPLDSQPTAVFPAGNSLIVISGPNLYCYPAPDLRMVCEVETSKTVSSHAIKIANLSPVACYAPQTYDTTLLCLRSGEYRMLRLVSEFTPAQVEGTVSERLHEVKRDGKFIVKEWDVAECGFGAFIPDFVVPLGKGCIGFTRSGGIATFKIGQLTRTLKVLDEPKLLPITALHEEVYAKGTYDGSIVYCKGEHHIDGLVKKVVTVDSNIVVISESKEEESISGKITVFDSSFKTLADYEFDTACTCSDVVVLEKMEYTLADDLELTDEQRRVMSNKLSHSLIVIGSSSADEDSSEILVFYIENDLELLTMASVDREVNLGVKLNEHKCLLIGSDQLYWISFTAVKEDEVKINLVAKSELSLSYPTQVELVSEKEIVVADSFDGLYDIRLSHDKDAIGKMTELLSHSTISSFQMIQDALIVGDLMGNIQLFQLDHHKLSMIYQTNLMAGAIGIIEITGDDTLTDIFNSQGQICRIGTSEGSIITIEGSVMDTALLNYQSYLGSRYDIVGMKTTTKQELDLDLGESETLDRWYGNQGFLDQRVVRRLPGSATTQIHQGFESKLPEITLVDMRYIQDKLEIYGESPPEELESLLY